MPSTDVKTRIQALRQLLESERASTQEELRTELEKLDFIVNQSTISRDLRRLGAMKLPTTMAARSIGCSPKRRRLLLAVSPISFAPFNTTAR